MGANLGRNDAAEPAGTGSAPGSAGAGDPEAETLASERLRDGDPGWIDVKDASQGHAPTSGTARTDVVVDPQNPNIVHGIEGERLDETAGVTGPERVKGTYPDFIEGSDSPRTGTSWGLRAVEEAPTVTTPEGVKPEGTGPGDAQPTRNTGDSLAPDELDDVGSWSTFRPWRSGGPPTSES